MFRLPVIKTLPEDNVRERFLEADKYRLVSTHSRMRELLALNRSWVDIDEGLIHVNGRATKNRNPKTAPIYGDMKPGLEMLLSRGNMIRAGVPEKVAMQISGHKTASMLWRYNITDARDIKEAGKRTRAVFGSTKRTTTCTLTYTLDLY